MMNALRDVVPHIDEAVFSSLGDKLIEQLRSSVGLTTRTGTCQFIIDLCLRRQQMLLSFPSTCDKMVRVLMHGFTDRNPAIKKQFSSCLSYLIPFCSKAEVNRVMDHIKRKLQSEQDDQLAILHLLRALARNTEILSKWATDIVPYVFLCKCQSVAKDDETGKKRLEMWEELWSDLVPGSSACF
ncbi:unnamed protein product [Gongylonema pulchrum]|uniref:Maestro heat-like repeat-containing protein family member 7 n=1 Tax=Gongylonema pulchrum TaxID=637853 RepID=A0A183D867_9BILA|nr:unnamed protein product [Gongylonema pulchrum]